MGTPLLTSNGYEALLDGYDAAAAKFFALGNATEGGSTLSIGKDRTTRNYANRRNPTQIENGVVVSASLGFDYEGGMDPGTFADPHYLAVIGQAAVLFPTIVGDGLAFSGGVGGAPLQVSGTAIVRDGFTAYKSPYVTIVRFETDGTETALLTPVAQPDGFRAAVALDGTLPVAIAMQRNGATDSGDNAIALQTSAGAQDAAQTWNYHNGLRVETPAGATYNGVVEKKTGAPNPTAAVTAIVAFNLEPIGLGV